MSWPLGGLFPQKIKIPCSSVPRLYSQFLSFLPHPGHSSSGSPGQLHVLPPCQESSRTGGIHHKSQLPARCQGIEGCGSTAQGGTLLAVSHSCLLNAPGGPAHLARDSCQGRAVPGSHVTITLRTQHGAQQISVLKTLGIVTNSQVASRRHVQCWPSPGLSDCPHGCHCAHLPLVEVRYP